MTNFSASGTLFKEDSSATELYVFAQFANNGWASLLGSFGGTVSVVTQAFFDNNDPGVAPNLLITGLAFTWTPILNNALNGVNFQEVLTALLAGNDTITGSSGADVLDGFTGNDILRGGAGTDVLIGGPGHDVLIGGPGADALLPNASNGVGNDNVRDIIRYTSLSESGITAATRDDVVGFIPGAGPTADRIDLSPIDANPSLAGNQSFHLVSHFTAAKGEVHLVYSGPDTIIQVDGDNDPAVDMTIFVSNAHLHAQDLIM
jgi:Ca2+-binding RTX toxin-like protein